MVTNLPRLGTTLLENLLEKKVIQIRTASVNFPSKMPKNWLQRGKEFAKVGSKIYENLPATEVIEFGTTLRGGRDLFILVSAFSVFPVFPAFLCFRCAGISGVSVFPGVCGVSGVSRGNEVKGGVV